MTLLNAERKRRIFSGVQRNFSVAGHDCEKISFTCCQRSSVLHIAPALGCSVIVALMNRNATYQSFVS